MMPELTHLQKLPLLPKNQKKLHQLQLLMLHQLLRSRFNRR
jgi:hypothetical protein